MSTDDDHEDDGERDDGSSELRAKDLLTRTRAELADELDPATMAQLESWFDMPNLAAADEQQAMVEEQVEEDKELVRLLARREAACAASDPAFVAHIVRHESADIRQFHPLELAPIVDERLLNPSVRAVLDRLFAEEPVDELRLYHAPADVDEILAKHNAPQAILRDLYRPVNEYDKRYQSPFSEDDLPHFDAGRAAVREALRDRHEIEWLEPGLTNALRAKAAALAILKEPWNVVVEAATQQKNESGS